MKSLTFLNVPMPGFSHQMAHWPVFSDAEIVTDGADEHWMLVDDAQGSQVRAFCSLWWTRTPAYEDHRVGLIGRTGAEDPEACRLLLDHVCEQLRRQGCTMAIGPMDGNTFRRYRWLTERGSEPPFSLEPDNPDDWPAWWLSAGFAPIASYYSAIADDLTLEDERIPGARERLRRNGIVIRTMGADYRADLERIYEVAQVSFAGNFLASPFTLQEFLDRYLPFEGLVRRELVLIAELEDRPVGFMFSLPDYPPLQRGDAITQLVMKTFAVLPGRIYAGLGNVLLANSTRIAHDLGFQRAIHALMYEHNNSLLISTRFTRIFRRYALYARRLMP